MTKMGPKESNVGYQKFKIDINLFSKLLDHKKLKT